MIRGAHVILYSQDPKPEHSIACSAVSEERWGSITYLTLPGGGKLGVYQPKHASPLDSK